MKQPRARRFRFRFWALCAAVFVAAFAAAYLSGCADPDVAGYPLEANHREPGERFSGHLLGLIGDTRPARADLHTEEYQ